MDSIIDSMDLDPNAFVQPEINRPEEQGDASSGASSDTDSIENSLSHREETLNPQPLVGNESFGNVSCSFATSSVSSISSIAGYHTPPWEVSLAEFKPTTSKAVSYDRDAPTQKLVGVIGREFDTPVAIADKLQKQYRTSGDMLGEGIPRVKFLGYQVRRKELLSDKFKMEDLQRHDAILFCYNASEARILLTGSDGFYSSLLRQVERTLGPGKAGFALHNYLQPRVMLSPDEAPLLEPFLRERLQSQEALQPYLAGKQVLSWSAVPAQLHLQRLCELADLPPNPVPYPLQDNCSIL